MPTKRHLGDLWVQGKEVEVDDGRGEPVKIWLQKITATETSKVLRKANSARAAFTALKEDKFSPEYQEYVDRVRDSGNREDFVEALVVYEVEPKRAAREDELASEEPWSEDNMIQGLFDAWEDGLKDTYALEPDDPEAKRVFGLLEEFSEQVEKKLEVEREKLRSEYESVSDDEILYKMADRLVTVDGDYAWMEAYATWLLYFAVRDPETKRRYFEDIEEVRLLQTQTIAKIRNEYESMSVGQLEGKGSQETTSS